MNQTLSFNTKSFSESKSIKNVNKKFNYGELGRAMLVIEIDRYMMKAEAANSRTRLATQFATGEASIVDKVKSVSKAIWDAIIKLFESLRDMIKNFLARNKDTEKKLISAVTALQKYQVKLDSNALFSLEKIKKAKEAGTVFKVIHVEMDNDKYGNDEYGMIPLGIENDSAIMRASSNMFVQKSDSVTKFLNALVPNGADENLSVGDYEKKLTKVVLDETSATKAAAAKGKKEGPKMDTLKTEEAVVVLSFTIDDLLALTEDVLDFNINRTIKGIMKAIDVAIKDLQSFKDVPDDKGNVTTVSDNNLTKARLSLHKVASGISVYLDASYVSYTNLTKSILLTMKNVDSLS